MRGLAPQASHSGRASLHRGAAIRTEVRVAPVLCFLTSALLVAGCPDPCADRPILAGEASLTTYASYAACCPENPNYDPAADTTECTDYAACDYSGEFAAVGSQSYPWVQSHNLVAFYDDCDPDGDTFDEDYAGRMVRLTKGGVTFDALIADTCGNEDCDDCCSSNAGPQGILVDAEQWTVLNNLGDEDEASGRVEFELLDTYGAYPGCEPGCGTVDPVFP